MPSSRRQTSATTAAFRSVNVKRESTIRARSTNNRTAPEASTAWRSPADSGAGTGREPTAKGRSPSIPKPSRLVIRIREIVPGPK